MIFRPHLGAYFLFGENPSSNALRVRKFPSPSRGLGFYEHRRCECACASNGFRPLLGAKVFIRR